jgi:hypothetical protein
MMQTNKNIPEPTATPDYFGMIEHSIALLEFPVQ